MALKKHNGYEGDLARLTALAGGALAFFGALLLAVIAFAGWSSNQTAFERERTLVENALNQSIAGALNEQKSVAWWDDAVLKITDQKIDLDFADANFGVFLTETYSQDEVYILNGEDKPIYAFSNSERRAPSTFEQLRPALKRVIAEARSGKPSTLLQRPDVFAASQANYRVLSGVLRVAHWSGHILSLQGRPVIVAAMTIVPNVDSTVLKGTPNLLVSVVDIDDAFVADIGRSLLLNDLALKPGDAPAKGTVAQAFIADDGAHLGELRWATKRPGQVLLAVILPLVALGVAVAGVIFANMLLRLKRATAEITQSEEQARHEALHDTLSGLPNRHFFLQRLEGLLTAPEAASHKTVTAYVDVDRFKDINDTMGHHAGDMLIKAVAERLQSQLRPEDFLARFGGDEFALLCVSTSPHGGEVLSRRVAQAFAIPFVIDGQSIRVTASVGIATAPRDGVNAGDLMRNADIALYEAKNQGRNRAILFSREMAQRVAQRRAIEVDLRTAIENDELELHFQPIVNARTSKIGGVEALLRWTHPEHGPISPATFVPVAEDAGLMPILGDWVLRRAMEAAKRWPELEMAVNLSPVQFRHADIQNRLYRLTQEYGVDPRRIVLEMTEGVLMEASAKTKETLDSIRAMGFKLALDDFGTGYSSFAYLCQFKFDKLKIDRSFVTGFARGDVPRSVINAVVTLGQGLGMSVVAEGVETEFDALAMRHFGCNEMQGFYFSKAVTAEAIHALLAAPAETALSAADAASGRFA
ncbi:MAG TPA: EAL domain-containing protein [Caulobacterales bacterium]|nr:EAL domain-containing protein [Caulobacterales bacterium]